MKNLQYRFHLSTPLAMHSGKPIGPLHFDGLLGWAWAKLNGFDKTPSEEIVANLVFPELPIEKIGDNCYCASCGFLPYGEELNVEKDGEKYQAVAPRMEPTIFVRHADWVQAVGRHKADGVQYQVSTGWGQAVQETYWLLITPFVDFFVRGEEKPLDELVGVIRNGGYLGGKRGSGFGRIKEVECYEMEEDWSVWKNGKPTRPVPVELVGERTGLVKEWATFKPPYWHVANSAWCYMPPKEQYLPVIDGAIKDIRSYAREVQQKHTSRLEWEEQEKLRAIAVKASNKKERGKGKRA